MTLFYSDQNSCMPECITWTLQSSFKCDGFFHVHDMLALLQLMHSLEAMLVLQNDAQNTHTYRHTYKRMHTQVHAHLERSLRFQKLIRLCHCKVADQVHAFSLTNDITNNLADSSRWKVHSYLFSSILIQVYYQHIYAWAHTYCFTLLAWLAYTLTASWPSTVLVKREPWKVRIGPGQDPMAGFSFQGCVISVVNIFGV